MAKPSQKFLVHCLVAMVLIALAEGANKPTICDIPLAKLNLCRPAVTGKYPPAPTKECCGLIKHANLTCLCNFKDALPAYNIDIASAFALPKKCKYNLPTPPQCQA